MNLLPSWASLIHHEAVDSHVTYCPTAIHDRLGRRMLRMDAENLAQSRTRLKRPKPVLANITLRSLGLCSLHMYLVTYPLNYMHDGIWVMMFLCMLPIRTAMLGTVVWIQEPFRKEFAMHLALSVTCVRICWVYGLGCYCF